MVQIRLMSEIYKRAECVVVWLGVGKEPFASEVVEDVLPRVPNIAKKIEELPKDDDTLLLDDFGLPGVESPSWFAFNQVTNSPSFSRLWVVQEATLAKTLVFLFGPHAIQYAHLKDAMDSMAVLVHLRDEYGRILDIAPTLVQNQVIFTCRTMYHRWVNAGLESRGFAVQMVGLTMLLIMEQQCHKPEDRILGILGLIGGDHGKNLQFDKSTSIVELYAEFFYDFFRGATVSWFLWKRMFDWAIDKHKSTDFPSWCPDFHRISPEPHTFKGQFKFTASIKTRTSRRGDNLNEMIIRGTIFDSVQEVGQPFESAAVSQASRKPKSQSSDLGKCR
jgi:hypothetical protein